MSKPETAGQILTVTLQLTPEVVARINRHRSDSESMEDCALDLMLIGLAKCERNAADAE